MSEKVDILIVDDERVNLIFLKGLLKPLELNIVTASSGKEALGLCMDSAYDFALILLDVMMPEMDGFETAERLRSNQQTQYIPIIFVTAISKEQQNIFRGYETGAVDYLIKPIEAEILVSKVQVFVDLHRRTRELQEARAILEETVRELEESKYALEASEERYRTVADHTHDWEGWIGPDGEVFYCSPSCERLTGYSPAHFDLGVAAISSLIHRKDLDKWLDFIDGCQNRNGAHLDFRIFRKDGEVRWVSQVCRAVNDSFGNPLGVRFSIRDIHERKNMEIRLRHQALHDPLTEVANRTLWLERMSKVLTHCSERDTYDYAVVFIDIDRFKVVNESLGHGVGDDLLCAVSERLLECVRRHDCVARFGGDEFVVLLVNVNTPKYAVQTVRRIREELARPYEVDEHYIHLTASMGLVLGKPGYDHPEDLLQHANIAMYQAKKTGRDRYQVFNTRMLDHAVWLMEMERGIRRGLENREFVLHYQPIVSLEDGRIWGFEALVRWVDPERGMVSPGEFIPVAEDTGLILPLGEWVLEEACRTLKAWQISVPDHEGMYVSVNLSARQFAKADLVEFVMETLETTELAPHCLRLEVTETAIMSSPSRATSKLKRLQRHGVHASVDDFGTGYSSMNYLKSFPLHCLKVDRAFVSGVHSSGENREIVRAVSALATSLGLMVIAEGIETEEELECIKRLGCQYGQGFLFSRPLPSSEAFALLSRQEPEDRHAVEEHGAK